LLRAPLAGWKIFRGQAMSGGWAARILKTGHSTLWRKLAHTGE
jgi:hypothetical protein